MSKKIILFSLFIFLFALSGCNKKIKSLLGLSKSRPDEFTIIPNQPLTVPPIPSLQDSNTSQNFVKPEQYEKKNNKTSLSSKNKKFMKQLTKMLLT